MVITYFKAVGYQFGATMNSNSHANSIIGKISFGVQFGVRLIRQSIDAR